MPPAEQGANVSFEQAQTSQEAASSVALEQAISAPAAPPPAAGAGLPQMPQPDPAQQTSADPASADPGVAGMPLIADDTDLIEKEWVDKAKQIVAQTSHDPYLQNKEINKVKADYLKKRYNKDVKLIDE